MSRPSSRAFYMHLLPPCAPARLRSLGSDPLAAAPGLRQVQRSRERQEGRHHGQALVALQACAVAHHSPAGSATRD